MNRSEEPLAVGVWHSVFISRTGRDGILEVDNQPKVEGISPGAFTQLSLPLNMYIGGVHDARDVARKASIAESFTETTELSNKTLPLLIKQRMVEREYAELYTSQRLAFQQSGFIFPLDFELGPVIEAKVCQFECSLRKSVMEILIKIVLVSMHEYSERLKVCRKSKGGRLFKVEGRPRQTSHREDRHIVRNARVQPTASSAAIQAHVAPSLGAHVSSRIIRRRMAEGHLGLRCPLRVLPLTLTHRRFRLEWCRARGN
ncbi:hypothetical protein TNCV_4322471 [Trichonephila clavipes]|uniref:Laminin G domain-containing protein n=1 Tax=Trichonephila clavipes TaxID=2585209 RepID=A0A8X6S9W4_TRICX|nr:hypothetical protein TNCV_4322471 [Trichonephila clavipes]